MGTPTSWAEGIIFQGRIVGPDKDYGCIHANFRGLTGTLESMLNGSGQIGRGASIRPELQLRDFEES